jgi:predicted Zn-dependent protease
MRGGALRRWGALALCASLLTACVATVERDIPPGATPPIQSDEAGLWMTMAQVERDLVTSGELVDDPKLQSYVHDIGCRLAPQYCGDLRIYVVEHPDFNASMAPNGFMTVWTGLILRCENEAQLATVIGHEIGHYQRRHTLALWRSVRASSNAVMVFSMAAAMAGIGSAGYLAQAVALGRLMQFSRDQEREADKLGFDMMVKAGYDPREAAKIWKGLVAEMKAGDVDEPFIFLATHPPSKERFRTLRAMAASARSTGTERGEKRFLEITMPHRDEWLAAELKRRRYGRDQVVLDRLMKTGVGLGGLYYYQGELYRRRDEEGDTEKAVAAYHKALDYPDAPAKTYRSLGFVEWRLNQPAKARVAFQRYLTLATDAGDRAMIESYVEKLQ